MILHSSTYLICIALMYLPVFLFLFFWRKDTRKEMLVAGLAFGIIAFLTEPIFIKYYWHPEYIWPFFINGVQIGSFEDFIYGFLKGGIAAIIYEEFFHKTICKMRNHKHHWKRMIAPIYLGGICIFLFCTISLEFNPVYSSILAISIFGIYLCLYRRDLLINAIYSALLVAGLTYIGFILVLYVFPNLIDVWWKHDTLSQLYFSKIPLEEILEGGLIGFFGGPFYEFFNGLKLKKLS